jgi:hypothetical protein
MQMHRRTSPSAWERASRQEVPDSALSPMVNQEESSSLKNVWRQRLYCRLEKHLASAALLQISPTKI